MVVISEGADMFTGRSAILVVCMDCRFKHAVTNPDMARELKTKHEKKGCENDPI